MRELNKLPVVHLKGLLNLHNFPLLNINRAISWSAISRNYIIIQIQV